MNAIQAEQLIQSSVPGLPGQDVPWLHQIRADALSLLSAQGFPHKKHEDWKYTSIKPIIDQEYRLPPSITCVGLVGDDIEHLFMGCAETCRIVFLNGCFVPQLSLLKHDESEMELSSLARVITDRPQSLQPYLAKNSSSTHGFGALNTAIINDGVYLHVHENKHISEPVHVLYLTTGSQDLLVLPRNIVVLDEDAQATVVEHYASLDGHASLLVDVVSETWLARGAVLEHIKLQQEGEQTTHIASHSVVQQQASQFYSHVVSLGGKLVRSDTHTRLREEQAECTLNGLYLAMDKQHMDFHTFMEHDAPACTSRQDYRGVLEDKARGVFNGRVYVHERAQKTDASQSNNTLLLSKGAEMDTKPQLEIYADDVKCSHGATVGQLDVDMMFYLRSRGLGEETARSFLVKGFVSEVITKIKHSGISTQIEKWVDQSLQLEAANRVKLS